MWVDFVRFYPFTADWAWENLPSDRLWDLVRFLPPDSAFHRMAGTSSPLEENVATLLDLVFHQVVGEHRQATFNPEKWPEHADLERAYKRSSTPPPAVPPVGAVALRPQGWPSLTDALTTPPEPVIEDVDGHEAHVRLEALLTD